MDVYLVTCLIQFFCFDLLQPLFPYFIFCLVVLLSIVWSLRFFSALLVICTKNNRILHGTLNEVKLLFEVICPNLS